MEPTERAIDSAALGHADTPRPMDAPQTPRARAVGGSEQSGGISTADDGEKPLARLTGQLIGEGD